MSGKTRESPAEALPTRRERAPSYASTHSTSQPRALNERILVSNESPGCATFEIANEDHTLGNVLRMMAMQDPKVSLAAYVVPHPLEKRLQVRIETKDESDPVAVLKRALQKVVESCDEFTEKFDASFATSTKA